MRTAHTMQKKLANLCRLILSDVNTRNLFFFLLLNFCFAFVELFYGLWTNSLGLISDSFHMFFDCSALLFGLAASLVTKWKPSDKFTYGFGRAEILAGLVNGLFLLFIALFIMKEAIERTFEPPEVHHERLFVISVLGFIVNLVGIFVFQHGGHGHGGCSHSHSHEKVSAKDQYDDLNSHGYSHYSSPTIHSKQQAGVVALDMNGFSAAPVPANNNNSSSSNNNNSNNNNHTAHSNTQHLIHHNHNHDHDNHHHHHHHRHHNHSHDHDDDDHHHHQHGDNELLIEPSAGSRPGKSSGRGQIMQSVFLHIVADTLGSVGVMLSAVLMNQFGWLIADPLCSIFIAVLISVSVFPLLRDSFFILMQRVPQDIEDKLPSCLFRIQNLNGVLSIHETHFWTLYSDNYVGCLKLEVAKGADHGYILKSTKSLLGQLGVGQLHIQIDPV